MTLGGGDGVEAVSPVRWQDGRVVLIDQTGLPAEVKEIYPETAEEMWEAIKTLRVRGAPAIGIAAAFGVYLGVRDFAASGGPALLREVERVAAYLATSRPTAVNLTWALDRIRRVTAAAVEAGLGPDGIKQGILQEAQSIWQEDAATCRAIGEHGAALLDGVEGVLTHCNAGGLATAQYGTALAPIYHLAEQGRLLHVYADETRPLLQGARLTAWELSRAGIPVTVIADNMAATVLSRGWAQAVIVGADRIAANGDVANKIGTFGLAIVARELGVPFYVAAPISTFDFAITGGGQIPIEERHESELREFNGRPLVPAEARVWNPAFDVTPHRYVTAIITERGVLRPPFDEAIAGLRRNISASDPV